MKDIDFKNTNLLLLDSSLISQTALSSFSVKVVELGNIYQLYFYNENLSHIDKNKENIFKSKIKNNNFDFCLTKKQNDIKLNEIRIDNIIRSRLSMQRIIQANFSTWLSFITLTFKDNILSLNEAHKYLNIFLTKIRKIKKDFKYLIVPEFQKRGAVHYHILSNLSIENDYNIIVKQKNNNYCYDILQWEYGFSSVFQFPDNFNIVGYLTKYLSKDIDDRYYSKKRYYNSHNLKLPSVSYLDLSNNSSLSKLENILSNTNIKYHNKYYSIYTNSSINFIEVKKIK